jgi:hypothetical protein
VADRFGASGQAVHRWLRSMPSRAWTGTLQTIERNVANRSSRPHTSPGQTLRTVGWQIDQVTGLAPNDARARHSTVRRP